MRGLIAGTQNPEPRVTAVWRSLPWLPVPQGQEGQEQERKGNGEIDGEWMRGEMGREIDGEKR